MSYEKAKKLSFWICALFAFTSTTMNEGNASATNLQKYLCEYGYEKSHGSPAGAAGEHLVLSRLLSRGMLAAQAPWGTRKRKGP